MASIGAFAQEAGAPKPPATPAACAGRAAIFTDRKTKLFVARRGTIVEDNPLRPLSTDPLLVLDLVVNGRAATAIGADTQSLHRGPAPAALEEQHKNKIKWTEGEDALPPTFRIVSEDGAVQTAFAFTECADLPKVAAPPTPRTKGGAAAARRPGQGRDGSGGNATMPRGLNLPQGAVPEGGKIQ